MNKKHKKFIFSLIAAVIMTGILAIYSYFILSLSPRSESFVTFLRLDVGVLIFAFLILTVFFYTSKEKHKHKKRNELVLKRQKKLDKKAHKSV